MKKYAVTVSVIAAAGLIALAVYAAGENSSAFVFSSGKAAIEAVGDEDVQIRVLHSRICPDAQAHGNNCHIQEIIGQVISAGRKVAGIHVGDCVGFRGQAVPCGKCADCRNGQTGSCRYAGWVCSENCRLHSGDCRNRIVTAQCNVIKISGEEKPEKIYPRLCSDSLHCPRLFCHDAVSSGSVRHCRDRHGHGRHCR